MGTMSDRNFVAMDSARSSAEFRAASAEIRATREINDASFMAGVTACREALRQEFGAEAGFTGRLMRVLDEVEPPATTSTNIKVRPAPSNVRPTMKPAARNHG